MRTIRLLAGVAALAAVLALAACGGSSDGPAAAGDRPTVVVTYSLLGSLAQDLVGDRADVTILMPNGVDPHDWQPSAKDIETLTEADLVVANGLHLEETLEAPLEEVTANGVPVFYATDHVEARTIGEGEVAAGEEGEHAEDEEHGAGSEDPHIWTDPLAMKAVVSALAVTLQQDLGLDLGASASELESRLDELNATVEETLSGISASEPKLVTGHESMGYFADRYGFELVGAIIPSISSQAEASAAELARLKEQIETNGVHVIFTEIGTPDQVAEAIADEAGATVVELPSHNLPDDGSYFTFMQDIATTIANALAANG